MKILIIGAAGMVGKKLVARLCADGGLGGAQGQVPLAHADGAGDQ